MISSKITYLQPITLPTEIDDNTQLYVFKKEIDNYVALVKGDVFGKEKVLLRLHSECMFGDIFGSKACDCKEQLDAAKQKLKQADKGILFYLPQEGRGIGLRNKVEAYRLKEEKGYDTAEANKQLGFSEDLRDYNYVAGILKDFFKVKSVMLLSNNPHKIKALENIGIAVEIQALKIKPNKFNEKYLQTKKEKFGHRL
ncbi:GTP cyclohydrolase II [Candidatus Woesearchaeota archaeon]|nr:GTP cyclohydrolase II [Candidatus Woesearchaeota archaeon]